MIAPVLSSPSRTVFVSDTPRPEPLTSRQEGMATSPRQPVMTGAGGHLSYSQIRQFGACPLQWWLARRYTPAFVPVSLAFGGGFHAALETLHRGRAAGNDVEVDALVSAFRRKVCADTDDQGLAVHFNTRIPDRDAMLDLAGRMLRVYRDSAARGEVLGVGEDYAVRLSKDLPVLRGRIDLMEIRVDADGIRRLHLVDFKTASRKPQWEDIDIDPLLLCGLAAPSLEKVKRAGLPVSLDFVAVTKTKTPEIVTIPVKAAPRQGRRVVEKIRVCHAAMRAGHCYPAPGLSCSTCGYSLLCAVWPRLPATARNVPLRTSA